MPEIRLAWRAVQCYGSHDSHVVIGIAPSGEQRAVGQVVADLGLRVYNLPPVPAAGGVPSPCHGFGGDAATLGVLRLSAARAGEPWDSMLTVTLREFAALPELVEQLGTEHTPQAHPFIAAVNIEPARERRFFDALAALPRPSDFPEFIARARELSPLLAAPG